VSALPLKKIEGKYEILDKLGEGGMGALYMVRHRLLDEIRVIKMMRPQFVEDEELRGRFVREARLAIKLRHPNVAQLYDFTVDEEDGTAFIVMEFINGLTFEEILKISGPPPLGLAVEMAQQSLRALGYLHGKGMIHRDISPDNLMLTQDTEGGPLIKLIDLGIAKHLGAEGQRTATGMFLGKVRYAPPEQFGGGDEERPLDARGDLYSFGVVLYELLTGRYPISGRDPSSIIAGHLFRPPLDFAASDPKGRIPDGLRALVLAALAKEPAARPQAAQELSSRLAEFRVPADVTLATLERALRRKVEESERLARPDPGSTQERLDLQFGLAATPPPQPPAGAPKTGLKSVRQAARPTRAQRTGEAEIKSAASTIRRQLQEGEILAAEAELRWAVDLYGKQPEFERLRKRLQTLRAAEVERQVGEALAAARELLAGGDLAAALAGLERARALDPDHREVAELLAETEAALARQTADRERARAMGAAVQEIEAALGRGDLRAGETLLYSAEAAFGQQEAFSALHRQLAERRQEIEERRRAEEESAPAAAAEPAVEAEPDVEAASATEETAESEDAEEIAHRQAIERRRAEKLAQAVATIRGHLDRGALERAGELLDRAVAAFGAAEALRAQWERLETLRRQARAADLLGEAEILGKIGEHGPAARKLRQVLELDPDNARARELLAAARRGRPS
jgi:serine/threonine-protein kinase